MNTISPVGTGFAGQAIHDGGVNPGATGGGAAAIAVNPNADTSEIATLKGDELRELVVQDLGLKTVTVGTTGAVTNMEELTARQQKLTS